MCKEWLNISEIADLLQCSRPTVYKKIDTVDTVVLQTLQKRVKNVTYYNYKLVDILKEEPPQPQDKSIDIKPKEPADLKIVLENQDEAATDIVSDNYRERYISHLEKEIEYLKQQQNKSNEDLNEQLREKDKQIKDLNERLTEAHELTKNMQVLQLRQQPQDVKALEEHFKEFDSRLAEIREDMQQRKNKKRLFSFFKKE